MAVIAQQNFVLAPSPDKYLSLANEEFVRRLDLSNYGNNWNKMRIGINCSFANTGGGNLSSFMLFIGLCSGIQYPFQSQQCVHAVGYAWGDFLNGPAQAATYNAGGGLPYYSGGLSYNGLRKVGQSITSATIGSATFAFPATGGSVERRGWVCADITKSATQVFPGGRTAAVASVTSDVWYEHFIYANNQQGGTPYVLESLCASNSQTFTPGAGWDNNRLDSVDIFWQSAVYEMRIYAIWVCFSN